MNQIVSKLLRPICVLLIILSVVQLYRIQTEREKIEAEFDELAALLVEAELEETIQIDEEIPNEQNNEPQEEFVETPPVNEKFSQLYEQNSDLVGWLTIPNTNINYPVVKSSTEADFYIDKNFEKTKSDHGIPFLDSDCNLLESENFIIYGHNMKDYTMFSNLIKYKDASFCKKNSKIIFETLYETLEFEVVCVLQLSIDEMKEFPYAAMIDFDAQTGTAFDYFTRAKHYALWSKNDIVFTEDTRMLTLSTCDRTMVNGRFLVIAKTDE